MKPRGVHLRRTWIHSDRRDTTRGADLGHSPALVGEEGWGRAGVACLLGRPAADQLPRPHGGLGWLSVWPPRCHHGSPVNVPSGPGARRATRHRPGGEGAAAVLPLSSWRSPWWAGRAPPGRERGGTSVPQRRLRRAPGWRPRLTRPLLLSSQVCPRVPFLLGTLVHHTGQDFIHRIWVHGTFGAVSLFYFQGKVPQCMWTLDGK